MRLSEGMKATYKVDYLVETLKKFREEHRSDYIKAVEVYHRDLKKELSEFSKKINKSNKDIKSPEDVKPVMVRIDLATPENKVKEYDKLINVLDNSVGDDVELDSVDANHIINDDWDWIKMAKFSNAVYSSRY